MGVKFWLGEVKSSRDEREQQTSCHRAVYKMVREVKGGLGEHLLTHICSAWPVHHLCVLDAQSPTLPTERAVLPQKGGNSSSRNNCCSAWGAVWTLVTVVIQLHAFRSTLPIAIHSVVLQDASYYSCTFLSSLNAKHVGASGICNWKEAVGESSFPPRSSITHVFFCEAF